MRQNYLRVLLLALLLGYWGVSLANLTVLPIVYEDEPWQISTGWKLAEQGILGSDMWEGYHGRDEHYYGYMPLHPIALAVMFRAAGLGLLQARYEMVAWGLVILALTFRLAMRLWHEARIGLLAVAILLLVRGFALSPLHATGILFLDVVRVARYDVLVPLLGLAALHVYLTASARKQMVWYFLGGGLCALAGLAHVYGAFFLPVLLLLVVWERQRGWVWASGAMLAGFALPWLFYAGYVLQDVEAWRGQMRAYGERFEVVSLGWYVENVARENARYSIGIWENGSLAWRPGFWAALVGLAAATVALGLRAVFGRDKAARVVLVPLVLFPLVFALLIRLKFTNYLFVIAPLAALALAWLTIGLWNTLRATAYGKWAAAAAAVLGILIVIEGVGQIVGSQQRAQGTTAYDNLIVQLREPIPRGTRVFGLPNYGLGWEGYNYRSIAMPFLYTNPQLEDEPRTLTDALDAQAPDYLLLDWRMRRFLAESAPELRDEFARWMEGHRAVEIARVDDASYGEIEIYSVAR